MAFLTPSANSSPESLLVAAPLADEDHRAGEEHQQRDRVHDVLGQERRRVAEQHRHRRLHGERRADPEPDQDRAVPGGEHQRREEGLVGQLDHEDGAEGQRQGGEIHQARTCAAGGGRGLGQHLTDRSVEGSRGAHDVVVLRLRVHHDAVEPGDLHRDLDAVDGDAGGLAGRGRAGRRGTRGCRSWWSRGRPSPGPRPPGRVRRGRGRCAPGGPSSSGSASARRRARRPRGPR